MNKEYLLDTSSFKEFMINFGLALPLGYLIHILTNIEFVKHFSKKYDMLLSFSYPYLIFFLYGGIFLGVIFLIFYRKETLKISTKEIPANFVLLPSLILLWLNIPITFSILILSTYLYLASFYWIKSIRDKSKKTNKKVFKRFVYIVFLTFLFSLLGSTLQ